MKDKKVWVEINPVSGKITRIFNNVKDSLQYPVEVVKEVTRKEAVGEIRSQVIQRATLDEYIQCQKCTRHLTEQSGEMNEILAKGKRGPDGKYGEVSIENCEFLCSSCHRGPNGIHGDRYWNGRK